MTITENHPIQELLFFVTNEFDDERGKLVRDHIEEMRNLLFDWVIGPPMIVEELEEDGFALLGGVFQLYSAIPVGTLPINIDRKHLEEIKAIVKSLCNFSKEHGVSFDFELDGDSSGSIEDGMPDLMLQEGLLDEWERTLNEKDHSD